MRHPESALSFDWDEENESKLAARNIYACDVEDVFLGEPPPHWSRNRKSRTASWFMKGHDRNGRPLQIGVVWKDEEDRILRAICGWQLD